ncbi:hypothetical protein CPB83DRAFT_858307 [Crepidotus variabilis]|uniref:Smr domain-containing protein n=1 Tax=Crepidotus variabilis TaxID=179855 RepID=A0A9P6JMG1_9AGAR|nr:hypothetical protein CPB83DRAFT_858307 [Crepidotus variabilis]
MFKTKATMTPAAHETLFEQLEKEFCPPLDPPLIAAFLHEIHYDVNGSTILPTDAQIRDLRTTLLELSLQAEDAQNSESSDMHLSSQLDETTSCWTTPSFGGNNSQSGTLTNGSSASSSSSVYSFGSPLGFLQTALPDVPLLRLRMALDGHDGDDIDLGDIIANILTEEAIRDMEERDIDGLDDDSKSLSSIPDGMDWETVKTKKKAKIKASVKKPAIQSRPKKIALSDVRQQHHVQTPVRKGKSKFSPATTISTAVADPWTQVSSISTQLSALLPSYPASTFSSFFHSPQYSNSYDAARAALYSLSKPPSDSTEAHTTILFHLLDIIMPAYEDLDIEQRSRVISDVELAVAATGGQADASLDLVNLLRDLDTNITLGLIHSPPSPVTPLSGSSPWRTFSTSPPDILPSTPIRKASKPSSSSKASPYEWHDVPQRSSPRGPNLHTQFIPAYARAASLASRASQGPNDSRVKAHRAMEKRNQALMDAAVMWQKGNLKNHGGEAALYYAERARDLQAVAKHEALNAARAMVVASRTTHDNHDMIDLHGTKVAEAIVIVKEILIESAPLGKPLKIITGRGNHSAGRVSVLKPAVKNALVNSGWDVSSFDGGLVVRGRHG